MLLWNYEEIKAGWAWAKPENLRKLFMLQTYKFWQNQETPEARLARKEADPNLDPHYKLMLRNLYEETPIWWWGAVVVIAWALGLGCLYGMDSTLPCKRSPDHLILLMLTISRVGLLDVHYTHLHMCSVLRRADGNYRLSIQYPAYLSDACRIYVQGPPIG